MVATPRQAVRVRKGSQLSLVLGANAAWRWIAAASATSIAAMLFAVGLASPDRPASLSLSAAPAPAPLALTPELARVAAENPARKVDVIIQLQPGMSLAAG